MALFMQQPATFRLALVLWSALCALTCGGKTSDDIETLGGNAATGGWSPISTGGAQAMAGTYGYTVGAIGGTAAQATGGAPAVTTTAASNCSGLAPMTFPGSLSISSGYVTSNDLRGYGFTWVGDRSVGGTCVVPYCGIIGCTPAFDTSALCVAGVVAADSFYDSIVGVGFNLNQESVGTEPMPVPAPTWITVDATYDSSRALNLQAGNGAVRVQVVDSLGITYCAEAGSWVPGKAIRIANFNTSCWDGMGVSLTSGTPLVSFHLVVPSDATMNRPFSFCLTGVTFS